MSDKTSEVYVDDLMDDESEERSRSKSFNSRQKVNFSMCHVGGLPLTELNDNEVFSDKQERVDV